MLKTDIKLKKPKLSHVFAFLFSLKIILPVFVPALRFGVLRSLAFLVENVLGHSVKSFLFEITKLAIDITRHRTKPPSIFSKGIRSFLTEILGSADILLEDTIPYLFVLALPTAAVAVGIILCLRPRAICKTAGTQLFRSVILLRGIIVGLITPIVIAGGVWLCIKGRLPIFLVFTAAAVLTAIAALIYHIALYRISHNMLEGLRGAVVAFPRKAVVTAAAVAFVIGILEPIRLIANFDRYGFEAVLSLLCGAAYIVFGILLLKRSRR